MTSRPPSVLSIAGSDSGGGAGIQADLKSFSAFNVHGLTAIAALTAQNTRGVTAVHVPPVSFLREQINCLFADFDVKAVKLGMLASAEVIETVVSALKEHGARNIVVDPVMVSTTGARLLDSSALDAMRNLLLPMASLVTPNLPEAELLCSRKISTLSAMQDAAIHLHEQGSAAILMKGGHLTDDNNQPTDLVVDYLFDGQKIVEFSHARLHIEGHGTGCTLSSAIAANLALGLQLEAACKAAEEFIFGALENAYQPGLGEISVLAHHWKRR